MTPRNRVFYPIAGASNALVTAFRYSVGDSLASATFSRSTSASYVNSASGVSYASAGVARDSHYISGTRTLLLEGAQTNLFLQTADVNSWTRPGITVSLDAINAPDGTLTADRIIETAAGGQHGIYQTGLAVTAGQRYTVSAWVKAAGKTSVNFFHDEAYFPVNQSYVYFNLATGTVSSAGSAVAMIEAYADGWYLCSTSAVATSSTSNALAGIFINQTSGTQNYTGDGTSGLYVWGMKYAAGLQRLSYIHNPTSASAARSADSISFPAPSYSGSWTQYERYYDLSTGAWVEAVTPGSGTGVISLSLNRAYRDCIRAQGTRTLAEFQSLVAP